ncbi:hypothetical protein SAMN04489729_3941 [Amycolatopsis lurida]|uniref:Uncharacterized protein n=1 Tax=Amycolatopsis lurida NRRL 2430 TaxID=1460371 RepID=A0A2P2G2L6_AMYLU|nr:hypothetical protein [Amycolatopsis lurida]KFU83211.1 hypothetical protein BB31_01575 [Amycolatopsis lurida NRRL 2430]SED29149.1 hypothetical protein SAMN04489729_3941 [Amycolatopsis lurida]
MTDDLGLPGRRELPPEVLDNLRMSLREGMGKPERRRWPIAAAAAAVVLVLAGALVTTVLIREPDRQGPVVANPDFSLDRPKAEEAMNRCWAALQTRGRAASFPARDAWVPQFTVAPSWTSVTVVAVRAGDKTFFCETTSITVTVSDPDTVPSYATGTKTAALLTSHAGTVAGVADPGWEKMEIFSRTADSTASSEVPIFRNGNLFVLLSQSKPSRTTYSVGPYTGQPGDGVTVAPHALRPAPEPAVTEIDRVPPVVPDRGTPAGEFFQTCVEGAAEPLPDVDVYETGTLLEGDDVKVVAARLGDRFVVCQGGLGYRDGTSEYYRLFSDQTTERRPVRKLSTETLGGSEQGGADSAKNPFIGIVPRTATTVKLDFGAGKKVDATVTDGTFAVWRPESTEAMDPNAQVGVVVLDAGGKTLHEGTLPLY